MSNNSTVTSQITLIMKIMEIENCSFSTAIDIIDKLEKNDLLNVYLYDIHGDIFNDREE